jgi:hypothetical protein
LAILRLQYPNKISHAGSVAVIRKAHRISFIGSGTVARTHMSILKRPQSETAAP